MQSLYQQQIMDHYHFPRNKGELDGLGCHKSSISNPSCGDQVTFYLCVEGDIIKQAKFTGIGCILSLAAADMLAGAILDKKVAELADFTENTMKKMVGIEVGYTRIKCILLPLQAVQQLLSQFRAL